uniref:Ribosomal protein S9 n=1 Tax=Spumella sp. Baekdong012001B8 TaxID=2782410 RepID=A0A7S6PV87_9STRA|nr:ribosomal protein S9 [Spumella sp. Baekdong012001B8]
MAIKSIVYNQIGKRKTAVASVFLVEGTGKISINKKKIEKFFFHLPEECERVKNIFALVSILGKYDAEIYVNGGGFSAQADAIRLAIAKSIGKINTNYRLILSQALLLFCDSRVKERRKYGLKKARKAPQYSKR